MRILGLILLAAGLFAAFGQNYVDLGLPRDEIQPVGFILIAIGGAAVAIGGRRRRRKARAADTAGHVSKTSSIGYRQPGQEPEPEKKESKPSITWGRGGDGN